MDIELFLLGCGLSVSEELILVLLLVAFPATVVIVMVYVFNIKEINRWVTNKLKSPFVSYRKNRQMNCYHAWRRLDEDYSGQEVVYRYRCEKCKLGRRLDEKSAKRFEEDFLSDY